MKILFIDDAHPYLIESLRADGYECLEYYQGGIADFKLRVADSEEQKKSETRNPKPEINGIIIRNRFKLDKNTIDFFSNLKFIARVGAGMENIDIKYAESKGIKCFHAPEGNRTAVGEHAVGMLLMLMNNLGRADKQVREGKWIREGNRGTELEGKTVGIIGYGNMGTAFAQRLKGFDCKVLVYDKYKKGFGNEYVKESSMTEIFNEADIVSLHLPLTEETNYLVDEKFISSFKKPIILINTSRGKIVKTEDLVKGLKKNKVVGACLDVLEYEGSSFESLSQTASGPRPAALDYLFHSERVILSPHIAGWTHESNKKMAKVLVEKIRRLD